MTVSKGHVDGDDHTVVRVGVVLLDGFAMMSFSAAIEPLRAANRLAGRNLYSICFIGASKQIPSSGGAFVIADESIGTQVPIDLLLVVAGSDVCGKALVTYEHRPLFHWLRHLASQAVLIGGVSGGPAVLARAGLMNGRRMTIHWDHAEALATLMPKLLLERSLYVRDRDRLTCAGGIAALDMMHALIAEHQGHDFARQVSDWFLHTDIRGSTEPQRAGLVQRYKVHNKALLDVIELMENHVADPLDLNQLARMASLSARQLNRQFQNKFGLSTIAFYRQLRVETGRNLLLQSALSVGDIATATGFVDAAHFGRCFRGVYGCSPSSLRNWRT